MSQLAQIIFAFFISASFWCNAVDKPDDYREEWLCDKYKLLKNDKNELGLLDLNGEPILNTEFKEIKVNCKCSDLIFANKNEGFRVYNSTGERILNFEIQDFKPSSFEKIGSNGTFYKFMKIDGNFLELHIAEKGIYKFINKPRGHNSVRVEQTYDVNKGLSLWRYKVNKNNYDSGPVYAHVCFSVTCLQNYFDKIDLKKLKTYFFKGLAILPDGTIHLYRHDGTFYEFNP